MKPTRSLSRILLVDDDPNDRLLAIRELKQEFPAVDIREALTWQEFEQHLQNNVFDIVITDYDLRWSTGLDILRAVKEQYPERPVVMFTNSGTQEVAVEAMKAGLDDYVLKSPRHMVRLRQAVRTVWENARIRRRATELEFRLRFLLNELQLGVFRATPEGQLLEANEGLFKLLGVANLQAAQGFFQQYIQPGATWQGAPPAAPREVAIPDHPQGPLWLQISETEVDADGKRFIDGLVSDVTPQKRAAAELRSLNQSLEARVAQRTSRLERLNHELEMFAFSVSHDLRAPIRQIDGFAAFLEQQLQSEREGGRAAIVTMEETATGEVIHQSPLHLVGRIRLLTARAGRMIDDLLQFSRTGRAEIQSVNVSMQRLVEEVRRQVEPQTVNRTVHWQVESLPTVKGDRNLLCKVWQNLIENALKYTLHCAEAKITIGSQLGDRQTIFFVRDNGIGFKPEEATKLFGVFQRLPNAISFDGTGMGLANVQRVIHRHQGRVWAEGELNNGATFYFAIPDVIEANPE